MVTFLPFTAPRPDQRATLRHRSERALEEALDTAALLDHLDGDADAEDDGTAEPALAALVAGEAQTRWAGFEGGAA